MKDKTETREEERQTVGFLLIVIYPFAHSRLFEQTRKMRSRRGTGVGRSEEAGPIHCFPCN